MRHLFPVVLLSAALALSTLFSCNDPTAIGSDLLAGDQVDVDFTDTLTLNGYIEKQDSVAVFFPVSIGAQYESFLVGDYIDPIFGRVTANTYAQITRNTTVPVFTKNGVVIDSVVLLLPYREERSYGKLDAMQTIEVYELDENLADSVFAYSNATYMVKPSPIGTVTFTPNLSDSLNIHVPNTSDSTIKTPPHLRIRLNEEFRARLEGADSINFLTGTDVKNFFKGFCLKPVLQSGNGGMLSFLMRNTFSGMRVYYHDSSNTYGEYLFPIFTSNVVTATFSNDYTGSVVEGFFPVNGVANDSLFFLQAMNGINLVLEVPYVQGLKNLVINKAELEFSIIELPQDDPAYEPIDRILVSEIVNDTSRVIIEDYQSSSGLANFDAVYGGYPTSDNKYRVNISAYAQDMIRGLASNKMVITISARPEKASRVVLAGPGYHDESLRPKIRLTFSRY